jgi:hypothetical protein
VAGDSDPCHASRAGRRWVWSSAATAPPRLNRRLPLRVEGPPNLLAASPRAPSTRFYGRAPKQTLSDRCHRKHANTLDVRMRVDERCPDSASKAAKGHGLQGSSMRPRRLELPPRLRRTRPSTLRYGCALRSSLTFRPCRPAAWTSWTHRTGCSLPACCHGERSSVLAPTQRSCVARPGRVDQRACVFLCRMEAIAGTSSSRPLATSMTRW